MAQHNRKHWSFVDLMSVIGGVLAVLGFIGYDTYRSFLAPHNDSSASKTVVPEPQPKTNSSPSADGIAPIRVRKHEELITSPETISQMRNLLYNLDRTRNTGNGFDYWPEGGLQITYFHLATFISYQRISEMSPYPVFLSGPHKNGTLDLENHDEFGHYNPAFVAWINKQVFELLQDRPFIESTKKLFDSNLRYTADNYWLVYVLLRTHHSDFQVLADDYELKLRSGTLPDGYYYSAATAAQEKYSYLGYFAFNISESAMYFWIRRHLDGTDEQMFGILDLVLRAYNDLPCPDVDPTNIQYEKKCYQIPASN